MLQRAVSVDRWYRCATCRRVIRRAEGDAPGTCVCRTRHPYPWIVLAGCPNPESGFVRVLRGDGVEQNLRASSGWVEDPAAWRRSPTPDQNAPPLPPASNATAASGDANGSGG